MRGASPAKATQLRKLLADWCNGAENSFPVQLVLLTRAQWRIAASIPRSIDEARKLLHREFTEQRQQATGLVKGFELTTTAKVAALEDLIKTHATNTARTVSEIRSHLSDADKTAKQIRGELERGAEKWNSAITDFQRITKQLTQLCAELQARPWRSHWVLVALLLIATFVAAYAIGLHHAR